MPEPARTPLNKVVEEVLRIRAKGGSTVDETAAARAQGWPPEELKARIGQMREAGFLDRFVQGITRGWSDEAGAALSAPVRMLRRGESFSDAYDTGVEERRAGLALYDAEHPARAAGGELLGSLMAPGGVGSAGQRVLGRVGAGAVGGAGEAFIQGAGHAEGAPGERFRAGAEAAPLGGILGGALGTLGRGSTAIGNPNAIPTAVAAQRLGVTPTFGMIGARGIGQAEQSGLQSMVTSNPISQAVDRTLQESADAAQRVTQGLSGGRQVAGTAAEAGNVTKGLAARAGARLDQEIGRRLDDVVRLVGADTPVSVAPVVALRNSLLQEAAPAQQSTQRVYQPVLDEIENILADAAPNGTIPYQSVRRIRTMVGKLLEAGEQATGYVGGAGAQVERLYGALRQMLIETADQVGPAASRAARRFDRYVVSLRQAPANREATMDILNGVLKRGDDTKAWAYLTTGDANRLARFRTALRPEEWDVVAGSMWDLLGRRTAGQSTEFADWSLQTFLTNWNKLNQRGLTRAAFGGTRYAPVRQAMDDLATLASSARDLERLRNSSNTAGALLNMLTMMASGGAVMSGKGATAALAAAGLYGGAKVLESGPVLRFLTRALAEEARSPGAWSLERLRSAVGDIAAQHERSGESRPRRWAASGGATLLIPRIEEDLLPRLGTAAGINLGR